MKIFGMFNFHKLTRTDKTLIGFGSSMSLLLAAANQTSEFAAKNPVITGLGVITAALVPVLVTISKEYIQRRYPKVPTDQINESTAKIIELLTLIQTNNLDTNQQLLLLNNRMTDLMNRIDELEEEAKQREDSDDASN